MRSIPGYVDVERIHTGRRTVVARARREEDGERVVLKLLKEAYPEPSHVARLRHECEMQTRAGPPIAVPVESPRRLGRHWGAEMPDLGGLSLREARAGDHGLGDLGTALEVAARLAALVDEMHGLGIVHKDINPGNVLYLPDTQEVRLLDFGIASLLTSEAADLAVRGDEGTPAFMSPEQTGRMNRSVDHRSDLYSLGATLYHLFTGVAPFDDPDDPLDRLGLVHAHIARIPVAPAVRRGDIPDVVSDLVLRLLEKDAEERYQSAFALRRDLEQASAEMRASGRVQRFDLRHREASDRLALPEQLFGRSRELSTLVTHLDRAASGGTELVVVRGRAGIGKSRLVREVERGLALREGHFISGKADQFFSDRPYGPLTEGFRDLVRRLLAASESTIEAVRQEVVRAVGPNGRLVIDVVPEVELLIGPQPPLPTLGPREARNLFQRTLLRFAGVFTAPGRPLVLFLDDLQWADGPTMDLIGALARDPDVAHMMVIMAFRHDEVGPAHPLSILLEELKAESVEVGDVELGPLERADVRSFIEAALRADGSRLDPLVDLVFRKTAGNPFFVNQFLTTLHADGELAFDRDAGEWRWDIDGIETHDYTENVVELVSSRIDGIPDAGRELLKVAACVGSEVELGQLAELRGAPPSVVAEDLWPALERQLLVPTTSTYVLEKHDGGENGDGRGAPDAAAGRTRYRFLHDRVQQAAYAMLDDDERRRIHLGIGRLLKQSDGTEGDHLFDLVNHLNMAEPLIVERDERDEVARLDLRAGRQARAAAAFGPALEIFEVGLTLLGDEAWQRDEDLAVDLHLAAAEAAYLNHEFERMSELGGTVLERADDLADRVRMREIEIQALIAQERRLEAIDVARSILAQLGVEIPSDPAPEDYGAAFGAAEEALAGRDIDALAAMPEMTDPNALAASRILTRMFSATYFAAPQLLPLVIAKLVELSGRFGTSRESAFGYTLYGLHLCAFADDIERGHAFGRLSRELLDRTEAGALRSRTLFIQNICIAHWKEPLHVTVPRLMEAYQAGLDTGDMEYSTHALMISNQHLLATGHELPALHERMNGQRATIAASREDAALSLFCIYQQVVANWLGRAADPVVLTGEHHDQARMIEQHRSTGDRTSLYHIHHNATVLAYVFGRFEEAEASAELARAHLDGAVGVHQIPMFHVYESLIALSGDDVSEEQRSLVARNQERVAHWAEHCPENNLHRWHLVEAERSRHDGDLAATLGHYDRAVELAVEHGYPHEAAIALERQGRFWLARGDRDVARVYLSRARHGFEMWGAAAKVEHLDELDIDLAPASDTRPSDGFTLDVESAMKAAEALTGLGSLDDLMGAMMHITLENAGARRGMLFLPRKSHLVPAVEAHADRTELDTPEPVPVDRVEDDDPDTDYCSALVRFALRADEPVVLDRALEDDRFETNGYLTRSGVLSVLCMPLRHQGNLSAVLYLENDLTTGAFTPQRLELLRLLSGQMAISIENARSYDEMVALNRAYERFVPRQFLGYLGRDEITEVALGDQVAADMSVMFLDVRDFARLSRDMAPAEIFELINTLLGRIEPVLARHGGFVDKYTGDGLMALFPESADEAVTCGVEILQEVQRYNIERADDGRSAVHLGVGIDSGELMLGTIGSARRMDSTVISSVVNSAARIEGLNKRFGSSLLISADTRRRLRNPAARRMRDLGEVEAGGVRVHVLEVYDADPPERVELKDRSRSVLDEVAEARSRGDTEGALGLLQYAVRRDPEDRALTACLEEMKA